jgi:riboflavin synthase
MFTGIIEEIGVISSITNYYKTHLHITCKKILENIREGDSVACNGICLTVIAFSEKEITVEVMKQSKLLTTIKFWKVNDNINLERAVKISDRLNGHIVQGHIDTTSQLIKSSIIEKTKYFNFSIINSHKKYLIEHGSITIDGVSLTVCNILEDSFQVALISYTFENTIFKFLKLKDFVNIEFDVIGKYVLNNLKENKNFNITEEYLIKNGF